MRHAGLMGAFAMCLGLTIGCGGGVERPEVDRSENDIDVAETTTLSETGCLTASGDRFVLAALETDGGAQTELYQLIGMEDELRQYVGREVNINGMAEPAEVATLREASPAAPAGTAGTEAQTDSGAQRGTRPEAEVRTEAETRFETRRMRVTSVTPTGAECGEVSEK